MNQKELTETVMMLLNLKKTFVVQMFPKKIQRLKG